MHDFLRLYGDFSFKIMLQAARRLYLLESVVCRLVDYSEDRVTNEDDCSLVAVRSQMSQEAILAPWLCASRVCFCL